MLLGTALEAGKLALEEVFRAVVATGVEVLQTAKVAEADVAVAEALHVVLVVVIAVAVVVEVVAVGSGEELVRVLQLPRAATHDLTLRTHFHLIPFLRDCQSRLATVSHFQR